MDGCIPCCEKPDTYQCSHCNICHFMVSYGVLANLAPTRWSCKHYVDCTTLGVIYLWMCECCSYYLGKTIRPFQIRAHKHLYAINICDLLSPLGRHRAHHHAYQPIRLWFTALEWVHPIARGGDLDRSVLQKESQWFKATQFLGLNEAVSYKSFI